MSALRHVGRDVGNMNSELPTAAYPAQGDGIVKVLRACAVDGEYDLIAPFPALVGEGS